MKLINLNEQFFDDVISNEEREIILQYNAKHYFNKLDQLVAALVVSYDYLGYNVNFEYIKLNSDNVLPKYRLSFILNDDTLIRIFLNNTRFVIVLYPSKVEIACDSIRELAFQLHNLNPSATTIERVSSDID